MKPASVKPVRCVIYTRVSTEHGLDQEFNSLDAQHDAASAYIKSQAHAGWTLIRSRYDDGGYSGGSNTRVKSCLASRRRSWSGSSLMQFSRSSRINGFTETARSANPTIS